MKSVWNYLFISTVLLALVLASGGAFDTGEDDENGTCNLSAECCDACSSPSTIFDEEEVTTVRIYALFPGWIPFAEAAEAFMADRNGSAKVIIDYRDFNSFDEFVDEIRANGNMEEGYYDGFISFPANIGLAVATDPPAFMDFRDFVRESTVLDWPDILPAYRDIISTYDGKIYMLPLDGDAVSLLYRMDIIEHFGLQVPRTWDEYVDVAKATHGKSYNGTTLNGSCIGRGINGTAAPYTSLVLASITQTMGTKTGHLFDPKDMSPLTGDALAEAIHQSELQLKYGADDELEGPGAGFPGSINHKHFLYKGNCVLTYNWGDTYRKHMTELSNVGGLVGVAQLPGSSRVFDRETRRVVPCDGERCNKFGTYYEDIGWVNKAPYATGGVGVAVAANVPARRQRLAADFFAYLSGPYSYGSIIPNATLPMDQISGQDPYRRSHFDIDLWVERGYPRKGAETYKETILEILSSKNLAVDVTFLENEKIFQALDKGVYDYLRRIKNGEIAEIDRAAERLAVAESIGKEWTSIIKKFDSELSQDEQPIQVQYQRSLGIYKIHDYNYIGNIRYFGWTLASLVILCSIVMAAWVAKNRKARIVRASQPIFLLIICLGCLLMGAGIYPLAIDDENTSLEACSVACMIAPWLLGTGFSCSFSALFSKTLRVNKLFAAATNFQRVTVTVKDVMKPFVVLLSLNVMLLGVWTSVNPLVYQRVEESPISSYGICQMQSSGAALTPVILFGLLNLITLIAANVQAFQARTISDEFSESKYIAIALLSILQALLIGIPVAIMTSNEPGVFTVIVSCFVFIVSMSLLLLMFVPKILLLRKKTNERNAKKSQTDYSSSFSTPSKFESVKMVRGPHRFSAAEAENREKDEAVEEDKQKLRDLKVKLTEQGIDASALFSEVGLVVIDDFREDGGG